MGVEAAAREWADLAFGVAKNPPRASLYFGQVFRSFSGSKRGLSSNGTEMYAKGVDRYFPEMRLRRIQE